VAFSLSQAFLALPISVAHVGPLAGVGLVVVIGLMNMLTMACMAEVCARSGDIRYGTAFLGRLVVEYLGHEASVLLTIATAIRTFAVLLAGSLGLGMTMAPFTHVPAEIWVVLLLGGELYFLWRPLKVTITATLLLLLINLGLFLPVVLLAFSRVHAPHLFYVHVPFLHGAPFDPALLQLLFGVILMLYIGHIYVIQCAKSVLHRDPSARSLIWGSVAGTACLTVIFIVWLLAVSGTIAPEVLIRQVGTAMAPLAAQFGPSMHVLGVILVIVLLGMSCLKTSNALYNLVYERLPTRVRSTVIFPRRRGTLLLQRRAASNAGLRLGLTYLGFTDGQPQLRLDVQVDGTTQRVEFRVSGHWEATALRDQLPALRQHGISVALDVLEASPERVCLHVTSPMRLTYAGDWDTVGLHLADALMLPETLRQLVHWMLRQGQVSLADVIAHTHQDAAGAQALLDTLIEQDVVRVIDVAGTPQYRVRLAPRRGRQLPQELWQALQQPTDAAGRQPAAWQTGGQAVARRLRETLFSERGRFWLAAVGSVGLVFLAAEWLLLAGTASFARVLGFAGVISNSLTAGIFPVLLLVSSRRKGDFVPGVVYRYLDHPLVVTGIYLLFLANLFLHGLLIWQMPLARVCALGFGLLVVGVTIVMLRRGVFARRLVVELREEQRANGRTVFACTASGQPAAVEAWQGYADGEQYCQGATGDVPAFAELRYAVFQLPASQAQELKVWAHTISPEGLSQGLPMLLEVQGGDVTKQFDLRLSDGQVVVPLDGEGCRIKLARAEAVPAPDVYKGLL